MESFTDQTISLRDERVIELRSLSPSFAPEYFAYLKTLTLESDWIGLLHHEVDPVEKLEEKLQSLEESPGGLSIGAFDQQSNLVGDLFYFTAKRQKTMHVAMLGIAMLESIRGQGLGRQMMEHAIEHARNNPQVEKLELGVFESNRAAIELYKSLGFTQEGVLVNRFKQPDGSYHNELRMGLWLGV
jgi:ribosomal protein S18 acetylase RimI-like enzyme